VSVEGGQRVEMKGVPKLQWMEALTANEARRQRALLDIREELKRRGVTPETFNVKKKLVTDIFRETRWTPLALAIDSGGAAGAVIMKGFHGLLGWETQEHVPFFHEFVGRVRVIACLDKEPSLLDMNALERILKTDELRDLKVAMEWTNDDSLILVWGPTEDVETAMREIESRALEACIGVPNETRQAFEDGTTTFERILPGPDRMYPDTDHPPVAILEERVGMLKAQIAEPAWLREERYLAMDLPERWARELSISPWVEAFDSAVDMGIPPKRVGKVLVEELVHLERKGMDTTSKAEEISASLEHLKKPVPIWAWTRWVMQGMKGQPKMASVDEVREAIKNSSAATVDGLMGDVMKLFKGWADIHIALQEAKAKLGQG
ncbi:MAG: hypothetical protein QCI38_05145, partial [Candidatus Thermoplasmatota archaeon]|nr:hypothetical protein [Candidatus Thermoplasmatota archaeon]